MLAVLTFLPRFFLLGTRAEGSVWTGDWLEKVLLGEFIEIFLLTLVEN